jgi:hypothetical protein
MPWHHGQSGNPGGLSKGSRRRLTDTFIRALARDWKAHGEAVIQRVRKDNPAAYFMGMLSLVPKDVSIEGDIKQALLYTEPMLATMAFLESIVSECDDPRVNKDGGESRAKMLTNNNSETSV